MHIRDLSGLNRVTPAAVLGALVIMLASASAVSPGFRGELVTSLTRQPTPYLELYFTEPAEARSCGVAQGRQSLEFEVVSRLERDVSLAYDVAVDSAVAGPAAALTSDPRASSATGTLILSPGARVAVASTVAVPADAPYRVTVSLPGRPEKLTLLCSRGVS